MNLVKAFLLVSILFVSIKPTKAQFNYGIVTGYDLYQRWVNPVESAAGQDRSAGNAFLNSSLGGKIWLGNANLSLSVEAYGNLGFLTLNGEEYFGMGSVHAPIMAKINFKGLSGFSVLKKFGYYFGGGWQINKTEFYGLNQKARDLGIERPYFETYVAEVGLGSGNKTKITEFFIRLGLNPELKANSFSIGFNTSYSIPNFKMPKFNMEPGNTDDEVIKM